MARHKKGDGSYDAKNLYLMYSDEKNRTLLLFLYPILKELRRLTNLFQKKTADSMTCMKEIKTFFLNLAEQVLTKKTIQLHSAEQLCRLPIKKHVEEQKEGSTLLLKLDEIKYGETFQRGKSFFKNSCGIYQPLADRYHDTITKVKSFQVF